MVKKKIIIKCVGMIEVLFFSFFNGQVGQISVIHIMADDGDFLVKFLGYLVTEGSLARA